MRVEFYMNGGKDKVVVIEINYVPQKGDVVWLGEPNPYRYVVVYRDFAVRHAVMTATVVLE